MVKTYVLEGCWEAGVSHRTADYHLKGLENCSSNSLLYINLYADFLPKKVLRKL